MDPLILEASDNHDNQPVTGATKSGGGWQKSIDEASTQPQWWARTNDESMRQMVMTATKKARMARAMVMAMRVLVDKEGKGGTGYGSTGYGVGNEVGVRQ
jgi:hypothetical protein